LAVDCTIAKTRRLLHGLQIAFSSLCRQAAVMKTQASIPAAQIAPESLKVALEEGAGNAGCSTHPQPCVQK
jgi:hypothetical protein